MRKILHKILPLFLTAALSLSVIVPIHAADPSARAISVFRVDGEDATLYRGARGAGPRANQRLSEGNVLQTGRGSFVYLLMDQDSILMMDQSSTVAVSSTGRHLVLAVQSGAALVDVTEQAEGDSMETRIGNTGLTIRGTLYTMSLDDNGLVTITMLSGLGEVGGVMLPAGREMTVVTSAVDTDLVYTIADAAVQNMNLITLRAVSENSERLLSEGIVTAADIDALPALIAQRQAELEARHAQQDAARARLTERLEEAMVRPNIPAPTPAATPTPPAPAPAETPAPHVHEYIPTPHEEQHFRCLVCGEIGCPGLHVPCPICGEIDCDIEHVPCLICGEIGCDGGHVIICDICGQPNCPWATQSGRSDGGVIALPPGPTR